MPLLLFLLQTMLISLSGAMAPGPVSAVALGKGHRSGWAGAWIAAGHGIVEMPLIAALLLGFGRLFQYPQIQTVIGLAGGAFLLWTGIGLLRSWSIAGAGAKDDQRNAVLVGALLSASNPYFLVWWAAVGMTLITQSRAFGMAGIILFAFAHWLCDAVWMTFLSQLAYRGGRFFGQKFQRAIFFLCGAVVLVFGAKFIIDAIV